MPASVRERAFGASGSGLAARTGFVCLVFTLLVSGLFAPDRGFQQDELWLLSYVRAAPDFVHGLVLRGPPAQGQPQRLLLPLPFALAVGSGSPRDFLQLLFCLTWLGTAGLAGVLAWQCFDRRPLTTLLAAALTASSTGDFSLNQLHALPAYLSVAAVLAALSAVIRSRQAGNWAWLAAALLSLVVGLFTYDAPLAVALTAPVLLAVLAGRIDRPLLALAAGWYAALVPYLVLLRRFLLTPGAHGFEALEPFAPLRHALRALGLFGWNVAPWHWAAIFASGRLPADSLAAPARILAGGLGVAILFLSLRRYVPGLGAAQVPVRAARVAALLLMALLSNASMATLGDLQVPFRSQLVSRVLVSIALAALFEAGLRRMRRGRLALWVLLSVQIGLGLDAGLVCQATELSLWRRRRTEMSSIVDTVAAVRPGATLLIQIPAGAPRLAMSAPVVGSHWLALLTPELPALIWNGGTGNFTCAAETRGFVCRNPRHAEAYRLGRLQPRVLPFETTLLMVYAPELGRFRLEPRLPSAWVGLPAAASLPAAEQLSRPAGRSRAADQLLDRPEWLGRWLPANESRGSYWPLVQVRDELVVLDPAFEAPGGLQIWEGRQRALVAGAGVALRGVLWSATAHRVSFRCSVSSPAGGSGSWDLAPSGPPGTSTAPSAEPAFDLDLRRGSNPFRLSVGFAQGRAPRAALWGCAVEDAPP